LEKEKTGLVAGCEHLKRDAAERDAAESPPSGRADDDETALLVLCRLDDALRPMLILDVPGPALPPRLVGGPFRPLEDDGGIASGCLLIILDERGCGQGCEGCLGPGFCNRG